MKMNLKSDSCMKSRVKRNDRKKKGHGRVLKRLSDRLLDDIMPVHNKK